MPERDTEVSLPASYDAVPAWLVEQFPELRAGYEEEVAWWEGEPVTAFDFSTQVLNPILRTLFAVPETPGREGFVQRALAAIERLLEHPDEKVASFAFTGILKNFTHVPLPGALLLACYAGPKSRACLESMRGGPLDRPVAGKYSPPLPPYGRKKRSRRP